MSEKEGGRRSKAPATIERVRQTGAAKRAKKALERKNLEEEVDVYRAEIEKRRGSPDDVLKAARTPVSQPIITEANSDEDTLFNSSRKELFPAATTTVVSLVPVNVPTCCASTARWHDRTSGTCRHH
eukprot:TRINITY_DN16351_c0_g1_i1.p1 TRINITY_DN16351_c0_g1~~TRINITY_DN16351_c0_g1_i1.p1  ORF type:complete len:127 (+),score=20.26 TRINITY_DN16351_c0_g1_i1:78-458(+)